ncbi:thioredoxin-dependent thiol peroxidase [Aggregatibacter kilianii]|jgi:peroxiredoxin Q, (thioredoxinreductase)|uniref:thioredoxin-dependent thiol peroxidase n=1 Tax=Aggregatibacter kilianii TaxID=2025884 RepID=UPI000D64B86C|nr:thioredoxin-dependent thiol peroxidase [Aggregatibacter kilianii]
MKTLKVGENAPHFTLPNQNNEMISLTQFQGKKVLVYFYPKALTPGCTTQACGLRDSKAELEKLGVVILGISPDSPKKLAQFIEKKELNFTLLSDEDHLVAEQFGVWGEKKFMGRTFDGIHRISFLIDEQGKIAQVFDKFKTTDHHQVVLDYLKNN